MERGGEAVNSGLVIAHEIQFAPRSSCSSFILNQAVAIGMTFFFHGEPCQRINRERLVATALHGKQVAFQNPMEPFQLELSG